MVLHCQYVHSYSFVELNAYSNHTFFLFRGLCIILFPFQKSQFSYLWLGLSTFNSILTYEQEFLIMLHYFPFRYNVTHFFLKNV